MKLSGFAFWFVAFCGLMWALSPVPPTASEDVVYRGSGRRENTPAQQESSRTAHLPQMISQAPIALKDVQLSR